MGYKYDPSNYDPDRGFTIAEIGPHRVRIIAAEEKRSKSTGSMMMEITAEIIGGAAKGSRLWEYIVYNEYADSKFGQILHACGKDPAVKREIRPELFIGMEATVQVKHDTHNGQKRAKIHYWKRPEEAADYGEFHDDPQREDADEPEYTDDIPF